MSVVARLLVPPRDGRVPIAPPPTWTRVAQSPRQRSLRIGEASDDGAGILGLPTASTADFIRQLQVARQVKDQAGSNGSALLRPLMGWIQKLAPGNQEHVGLLSGSQGAMVVLRIQVSGSQVDIEAWSAQDDAVANFLGERRRLEQALKERGLVLRSLRRAAERPVDAEPEQLADPQPQSWKILRSFMEVVA